MTFRVKRVAPLADCNLSQGIFQKLNLFSCFFRGKLLPPPPSCAFVPSGFFESFNQICPAGIEKTDEIHCKIQPGLTCLVLEFEVWTELGYNKVLRLGGPRSCANSKRRCRCTSYLMAFQSTNSSIHK